MLDEAHAIGIAAAISVQIGKVTKCQALTACIASALSSASAQRPSIVLGGVDFVSFAVFYWML